MAIHLGGTSDSSHYGRRPVKRFRLLRHAVDRSHRPACDSWHFCGGVIWPGKNGCGLLQTGELKNGKKRYGAELNLRWQLSHMRELIKRIEDPRKNPLN